MNLSQFGFQPLLILNFGVKIVGVQIVWNHPTMQQKILKLICIHHYNLKKHVIN
jgi:hypothetical protein